jgi:hypothetical protein
MNVTRRKPFRKAQRRRNQFEVLVASRLGGAPTAYKPAFGETWRGWSHERLDEREGPRPGCWCSLTACVAGNIRGGVQSPSRKENQGATRFDRRRRLMVFALEKTAEA